MARKNHRAKKGKKAAAAATEACRPAAEFGPGPALYHGLSAAGAMIAGEGFAGPLGAGLSYRPVPSGLPPFRETDLELVERVLMDFHGRVDRDLLRALAREIDGTAGDSLLVQPVFAPSLAPAPSPASDHEESDSSASTVVFAPRPAQGGDINFIGRDQNLSSSLSPQQGASSFSSSTTDRQHITTVEAVQINRPTSSTFTSSHPTSFSLSLDVTQLNQAPVTGANMPVHSRIYRPRGKNNEGVVEPAGSSASSAARRRGKFTSTSTSTSFFASKHSQRMLTIPVALDNATVAALVAGGVADNLAAQAAAAPAAASSTPHFVAPVAPMFVAAAPAAPASAGASILAVESAPSSSAATNATRATTFELPIRSKAPLFPASATPEFGLPSTFAALSLAEMQLVLNFRAEQCVTRTFVDAEVQTEDSYGADFVRMLDEQVEIATRTAREHVERIERRAREMAEEQRRWMAECKLPFCFALPLKM
jgi:hypothetical protein